MNIFTTILYQRFYLKNKLEYLHDYINKMRAKMT